MSHWALVVAAGRGSRMGGDTPKQYLPLAGRTVLEHSLDVFANEARIDGIMLVLGEHDSWWPGLGYTCSKPLRTAIGGSERAVSVCNGLRALAAEADDWILVHDAARPCLQPGDLARLIDALGNDAVGGLLALPARDTIKRAEQDQVAETLDRAALWLAQTPQMFRAGPLESALAQAAADDTAVTDECMAMEQAGYRPRLVAGSSSNIKITTAEDLLLADFILRQCKRQGD